MPETREAQVAELVKSGLELEPGKWPAFLKETCGSDAALRAEVESLLEFQQVARGFMQEPAVNLAARSLVPDRELRSEETIGDYKILSLIGRGGMGDVYLAQDRQLRRQVALKIVRPGMDSDDLLRRFQREEQILASLNHPNIARLYGGAVTSDGLPYFVMEHVDGPRLDQHCSEKQLSIRERLALFQKVCAAVTYAHQRLVIHRDIKPSNIRVTAEGEPKLLDFGIAKLLDSARSTIAEQTMTFAALTPEYASPEQVRGETMTTTGDVYSLGVVLYKLLTGQSPYRTRTNRPDEITRAITEQNPERPSTAVGKDQPSDLRNLKSLRGDLDNIVLMALRKEPERRYQSAGQFSADIQRHLEGLPVIARKDTFVYRASKFSARNKVGVAAAAGVFLAIVAGLTVSVWQARVAARERDEARREKTRAEEVKYFLERTLNHSNPYLTDKNVRETTVTDVLDEAAKRLESEKFANQPEIKAELEGIISQSYYAQGKYNLGRKHAQKYVDLQSKLYPENDPRGLVVAAAQASLFFDRGEMSESEKIFRRVLPLMRVEKQKGGIPAKTLAGVLNNFGFLRRTQGDSREAEGLFREALVMGSEVPPRESRGVNVETRSTLASTLADQGKFEEALQTARDTAAEFRQRGETSTGNFGFALTVLGGFLTEKGDYAEADANLRGAEIILRKFFQTSNLWLGDNLRNQAISFYEQGRYSEALSKVDETLQIYLEKFGPHYDNYPTALIAKGLILAKTKRPGEGEEILRDAVHIRIASLPKEHYWVALANSALGECLAMQQRYNEAEPLLIASYESLRNSQGSANPRTRIALRRIVALYENWGKSDAAREYRNKLSGR
jgi:serine/threonine protein kinase